MDEGFTRSYRRKWSNPVFRNLRDAGIWAWLTDAAAWRKTGVRFCDRVVPLERGQLVTSERFIADGFRVDRAVVRRLLDTLEEHQMIARQKTHGGTLITICNYDKYQALGDVESPPESPRETQDQPTEHPNKNEGNEVKKEAAAASARDPRFGEVSRQVEALLGNSPNLLNLNRVHAWLQSGADPDLDVYPTIRAVLARKEPGWVPRGLDYFDGAIADARARRKKPMPEGKTDDLRPPDFLDRRKGGQAADHRNGFAELIATGGV